MKETKQDVIDMANSLKALDADSIPVNFLHAIDGTPLEGVSELHPVYCLKVLALFRFINPSKEIRISGGREVNLRSAAAAGTLRRKFDFRRRLLNDSRASKKQRIIKCSMI